MKSKLVLLVLPAFCALGLLTKRESKYFTVVNDTTSSYRLVVGQSYFSSYSNGITSQNYIVLPTYIVNYSPDSLIYWGTDTAASTLFRVTANPFMHLEAKPYEASKLKRIVIPPHRSQRLLLQMRTDKEPDTALKLKVSMIFLRFNDSNSFDINNQLKNAKYNISDSIVLKYHHNHQMYFDKNDFKSQQKIERLLLPTIDFNLLTDDDRRNYNLSIDQNKISALRDTLIYDYRQLKKLYKKVKFKTAIVPVTLKNNSNQALAYYSMSCSWFEFYRTDTKEIHLNSWGCDSNIPVSINVPAHGTATQYLTILSSIGKPTDNREFRIGMNLNKYDKYDPFSTDFDQFRRYNVIWSNPVTLK